MDPERLRQIFWVIFFLSYLKATTLDYLAFSIHALDASIYDYAMMNTLQGQFMQTITGANHFGVHATPILFLLLPFHALFHSPLFTVFLHPLALFAGALLFDQCVRARGITNWARLGLLFAYLNCIWISRTLHYGFHVEIFYPILYFLMDLSLDPKKERQSVGPGFWISALLFLLVKEDAPFHLVAVTFAYFILRRIKFQTVIFAGVISAATILFYLLVLIPENNPLGKYQFVSSAAGAGKTPLEAVAFLLSKPGFFFGRYFSGAWWRILLPSLGLLIASPFFWIASLPLLGLYGLAGDAQMFYLTIYYAIPLVGPFFLGVLEGFRKVRSFQNARFFIPAFLLFLGGLLFFGSGYLVFRRADIPFWKNSRQAFSLIPEDKKICVPSSILPQFPYGDVNLVDQSCIDSADYVVLLTNESRLSNFPHTPEENKSFFQKVSGWEKVNVPEISSDIEIFKKREGTPPR